MNTKFLLDDVRVFSHLSKPKQKAKLLELGEKPPSKPKKSKNKPKAAANKGLLDKFFKTKAWQHSEHQYGFIPLDNTQATLDIKHVGEIQSDDLKNQRLNIHLDRFRVQEYPGGKGMHKVLFSFEAQNQLPDAEEPVCFSRTYEVQNGEHAALIGLPVFLGLGIGQTGIRLKGVTVNVENKDDEAVMKFLKSETFNKGLNLLTTAQPVLKPFTEMAVGLTKSLASRNKNVGVQDFTMGLDFSNAPTGAALKVGSYIAVQVPKSSTIEWADWEFITKNGNIQNKKTKELLAFNYVIFRITKH